MNYFNFEKSSRVRQEFNSNQAHDKRSKYIDGFCRILKGSKTTKSIFVINTFYLTDFH